ncbi:MAG: hypothetical protein J5562_05740 [Clostridia bacterium]|nr:hypothetical protein [Clostridia bacterium]
MLLDEIERNKPVPRESSTFSKFLSGASQITGKFDYEDPEDKERERIEEETLEKKARAIKNFIIPNNKEDILEFLMFSRSKFPGNYEGIIRELDDYVINEEDWENEYYLLGAAWVRKYLEAYEKATIFLPTDPDFIRLRKEREAVEEKIAQEEEEKRIRKENRLSAKLARKIKNSISEKLD